MDFFSDLLEEAKNLNPPQGPGEQRRAKRLRFVGGSLDDEYLKVPDPVTSGVLRAQVASRRAGAL